MLGNILRFATLSGMFFALAGCIGAPVLLLGTAGGTAVAVSGSSETLPQQGSDMEIKSQIFKKIALIPGLKNADVEVTVFNGIVLLVGELPSQELKSNLSAEVSKISGVAMVYDQLTIGANLSFSQTAKDTWITSKVKARMTGQVNPLHFKIVTHNSVVYLLGQVTETEGDQAANIAKETAGVTYVVKIFNYIAEPGTVRPTTLSSQNGVKRDEASPVSLQAESAPLSNSQAVPGPEQSLGDRPAPGPSASD